METQEYQRRNLINTLTQIGHGKLDAFIPPGLLASKTEPELLAHFVTWNTAKGKVRDSKVAFPLLSLRNLNKQDKELAENAVANLLLLSPKQLIKAYDFNKLLVTQGYNITGGHRRLLQLGITRYLKEREANIRWWDRTVLQHRDSIKRLYRITHIAPSDRAQRILFDHNYPARSIFAKIAKMKDMSAVEAAGLIISERIPLEVAIGSVSKAKDKEIVFALIEGMTGNQLITNSKMLERLGVMTDPALKGAYLKAIDKAKQSGKVEILKAGRAVEEIEDEDLAAQVIEIQRAQLQKAPTIDGRWVILGDKSGSMNGQMIETARQVAAFVTGKVKDKVHLLYFDTNITSFDVTGKSYDQILAMTKYVGAMGGTSIGKGLDYLMSNKEEVDGIIIVSDGGDNNYPHFHEAYPKYVQKMGVEPTVYFLKIEGGDNDYLSRLCEGKVEMETINLGRTVDYYSLPNLLPMLRANRYSLVDEIMALPLLTLNRVFERTPRI